MTKQKVLLLGAGGETGGDILNGLLEDGNFDITCLVRPASENSESTKSLKDRGLKILIVDIAGPKQSLAASIKGYDTIISTIGAWSQLDQLNFVDAIAIAGVSRFVPCGWTTISPRGGVMKLRDEKEEVHDRIFQHRVPYTIIDVGYWHQISFPRVPSGKVDYAMPSPDPPVRYGDGTAKNLLTDKRDIGRFVARIIQDSRTLNRRVFTYSDELSQKEIESLMEKVSGEKLQEATITSIDQATKDFEAAKAAHEANPDDFQASLMRIHQDYLYSKYIREDNTAENALYLGYLDARKLYPDFKPVTFEEFLHELLAGKSEKPYAKRAIQN